MKDTVETVQNRQTSPVRDAERTPSNPGPEDHLELEERTHSIDLKDDLEKMPFDDSEKLDPVGKSSVDRTGFFLASIGMASMVIVTIVLILNNNPTSLSYFAFHPPFQILAIAFFAYGILTLQPTSLSQPKAKAQGFARHHLFMFFLGFPFIAFGSTAIFVNKSVHGYDHFKSWHGFLGSVALLWMVFQILVGGGSVWFGGRLLGRNPKAVYKYHRVSGYPLLILLLVVVHLGGAWSNFAINNMNVIMRFLVFMVCPVLVGIGIGTRIRFNKMPTF